MIKKLIIPAVIMAVLSAANIGAFENIWEMSIKASILNAENRLVIGQRPEADDGINGTHDIPAFLAGDIRAYINLEDIKYWQDIKEPCNSQCTKTWNLFVESPVSGETVEVVWNTSYVPDNIDLILIDTATGEITDMKTRDRTAYTNTGKREFIIEALAK